MANNTETQNTKKIPKNVERDSGVIAKAAEKSVKEVEKAVDKVAFGPFKTVKNLGEKAGEKIDKLIEKVVDKVVK